MTSFQQKRKRSFPYKSIVFSIGSALFMIGLTVLLLVYAKRITYHMQRSIEMQVVMQKDITPSQQAQLKQTLLETPYIDQQTGIAFVSKEDAAQKVIEQTGENFLQLLEHNPLRDIYIIHVKQSLDIPATDIVTDLSQLPHVYEVIYAASVIEEISQNMKRLTLFVSIITSALIMVAIILINHSLRLALFSQRLLIRSMQLVGATDWFIKKPYVRQAAFYGAFSGILATFLLMILQYTVNKSWSDFYVLVDYGLTLFSGIGLIALGMLISSLSVYFIMDRYLGMNLDELH